MPVRMLGKQVAVEKAVKAEKQSTFLAMPEDAFSTGVVRHVGPQVTDVKPGDKVHFGKNRQDLKMDGVEMLVMEETNIYAVVDQ